MAKKLISVVTGCCNEVENLPELYDRIKAVMAEFPAYDWELLVADNHSTDGTRELLRRMAADTCSASSSRTSTPAPATSPTTSPTR